MKLWTITDLYFGYMLIIQELNRILGGKETVNKWTVASGNQHFAKAAPLSGICPAINTEFSAYE